MTKVYRRRCPGCRQRAECQETVGRLVGRGRDAYKRVEYRCLACGHVQATTQYPNLLIDFFSLPRSPKEPNDETR